MADGIPAIFVHYHEFEERPDGSFRLTNYHLRKEDLEYIYGPYGRAYMDARKIVEKAKVGRL